MIKFLRVRKLSELKITGVFLRKAVQRKKCYMVVSDMMKNLYTLLLMLTPIKEVHAFQKFVSVSITFVAINNEKILKKD